MAVAETLKLTLLRSSCLILPTRGVRVMRAGDDPLTDEEAFQLQSEGSALPKYVNCYETGGKCEQKCTLGALALAQSSTIREEFNALSPHFQLLKPSEVPFSAQVIWTEGKLWESARVEVDFTQPEKLAGLLG